MCEPGRFSVACGRVVAVTWPRESSISGTGRSHPSLAFSHPESGQPPRQGGEQVTEADMVASPHTGAIAPSVSSESLLFNGLCMVVAEHLETSSRSPCP